MAKRGPASSGPPTLLDRFQIWLWQFLIDGLFSVYLFAAVVWGNPKVFSDFRESPLELQPRRCEMYVCLLFIMFAVM
jgi:hypothetical protein